MPLRLSLGLSRKVGEPNYGSRGASVGIEMELESALVLEPTKLRERIAELFGLVRSSLADELKGGPDAAPGPAPTTELPAASVAGVPGANGAQSAPDRRPVTPAQLKALHALTRLHGVDLVRLVCERCHVERPEDLSLRQASGLIDELRAAASPPAA